MENGKVRLDADDFKVLVSGGTVVYNGVEICLADIGYVRMLDIVQEALYSNDDPKLN